MSADSKGSAVGERFISVLKNQLGLNEQIAKMFSSQLNKAKTSENLRGQLANVGIWLIAIATDKDDPTEKFDGIDNASTIEKIFADWWYGNGKVNASECDVVELENQESKEYSDNS